MVIAVSKLARLLPALAGLLIPSVAVAAPTWLSPTLLSDPNVPADGTQVAFSPQGDGVAVWVRSDGSNNRIEAAVRPAGGTFSAPKFISDPGQHANSPLLTIDSQGNAIAAWIRSDGTHDRVQTAIMPAGGNFGAPQTISDAAADATDMSLASDPNGNALVTYERNNDVVTSSFRPAGGSFQDPKTVSSPDTTLPFAAFDANGNAIVAWTGFDGSHTRAVVSFRPLGGDFSPQQFISPAGEDVNEVRIAMDPSGNTLCLFDRYIAPHVTVGASFRPAGGGFGGTVSISENSQDAFLPGAAFDANGNAVAVWTRSDGSDSRIQAAFRPAGGSFEPAKDISPTGENASSPSVAMNPSGDAIVIWDQTVSNPLANRIAAARRPAAGSFGATEFVSDPSSTSGSPAIALDAQGNGIAGFTTFVGSAFRAQIAGFDGAGPQLRNLTTPPSVLPGKALSFSVAPVDVWSGVGATTWGFGDKTTAGGTSVKHTYSSSKTFDVQVSSLDTLSNLSTTTVKISDRTKPSVSAFRVDRRFRVAPGRTPLSAALSRVRTGSAFRFKLSERAKVSIAITKPRAGRKVGRRCRRPAPKLRKRSRCALPIGTLTRRNRRAGRNTVKFSGRLGRRALGPGSYRATITATDASGNRSKPRRASFRIVG
jgi:hypothetical protein